MIEYKGKYTTAKVMTDTVDEMTASQVVQIVNDPSFTNLIVIMPDIHAGKGTVIGFTMELGNRIIPNIVGVDLSCGLISAKVKFDIIKDFNKFDQEIRKAIPMSMKVHKTPIVNMKRNFPYKEIMEYARKFVMAYNKKFNTKYPLAEYSYKRFVEMCERINIDPWYAQCSLGTLGGGNHFIEIGKDENNDYWITVHSGSRNLGLKIATYWQKIAKKDNIARINHCKKIILDKIKSTFPKDQWNHRIREAKSKITSTQNCEYLENEHMFNYFMDSIFAHFYARINRELMLQKTISILEASSLPEKIITSIHNYIDFNDMIIRKGAISSYIGQLMLIPFNMEDGMLICSGKSNKDWNFSAPHGSGRLGSRKWAKEQFNVEKIKIRMKTNGIFCNVIPADEVKEAYKDSEFIKEAVNPTAHIIHHVKPIINFKSK
jgi:RNA-splicing ligase RtcB